MGPVEGERGELGGYVVIAQDITERRAIERMKDEFIGAVSHELRTPLTSMLGALGLVKGGVAGRSRRPWPSSSRLPTPTASACSGW